MVGEAGLLRSDKVDQRPARLVGLAIRLLTKEAEAVEYMRARGVRIQFHVIARRIGREQAIYSPCLDRFFCDDAIEQRVAFLEELTSLGAVGFMLQDSWIQAF